MNQFKWKNIRWMEVQKRLFKQQRKIYNASKAGHHVQMYKLQQRLLRNEDAKLLAVRWITESNAMDNLMKLSQTQKRTLVDKLRMDEKASPTFVASTNPLALVEQRAKQMLAKFVLEPQWEALFESKADRPDQSHYDATQHILSAFDETKPQLVFIAEFEEISQINHAKLLTKLATFPEMENQIRTWLKKGMLVDVQNSPDLLCQFMQKTPSDILGSFLLNVAFHGLADQLQLKGPLQKQLEASGRYPRKECRFLSEPGSLAPHSTATIVQYRTSFMVTTPNQTLFPTLIKQVETWFKTELELLPTKQQTVCSAQGFDFVGFQFISIRQKTGDFRLKIRPSKNSKQRFIQPNAPINSKQ